LAVSWDELDVLPSSFPENGTPLVVLGDFNNHLEKSQSADFHTLLASFDLKGVFIAATYKSGNQLDLIYMHFCSTDHTLVTPLHTSDHFLLTLLIPTCLRTQHTFLHRSPFGKTHAHSHPPAPAYPLLSTHLPLISSHH